ncbi:hypothetical protein [Denitromonas iodatirespirans]|uniref:Uncharacterized protein n=1 Tax=Denitromonas iodatirespirans TaxID=2795389 RepID=A0A944D8J4_DENI1|nr:hypothetical protein [Denitromonas iodatirespirans]MBT0959998.1 hypothetical protein [Denitromonas iodatirespirans]
MTAWPAALALCVCATAWAGEAEVVDAVADCDTARVCRFTVTVRHADAGWEHYADAWEVQAPDGTVLGRRVLLHPHDTEQPFTRSLDGVRIPAGVDTVRVRAHDSVHGWGDAPVTVPIR